MRPIQMLMVFSLCLTAASAGLALALNEFVLVVLEIHKKYFHKPPRKRPEQQLRKSRDIGVH